MTAQPSAERVTPKQAAALAVLLLGDAHIEGHATTTEHGRIVNTGTARTLEAAGWAESYEQGRIAPYWMLRITDEGRRVAAESGSSEQGGAS